MLLFLMLGVVAGCAGRPTVDLGGTVHIDGQPVESGSIQFSPKAGGPTVGGAIVDGEFFVENVPVGPATVYFVATRSMGTETNPMGGTSPRIVNVVPARYKGGMDFEVVGSDDNVTFNLNK
jgi:hypothetical protein